MSFFDGLNRFVSDLQKSLKPEEAIKLRSCKKCSYYRKGYCTQTSTPTRILSEYWAQGCLYFTTEAPVIGKDVTELATKADVASMKADISAMKATLATVGVMRVAQLIEKKGGGASLNTYSSDAQVSTDSTTYVLKREFDIATPTPPSGITVYKYALMVSFEMKSFSTHFNTKVRIEVDDELWLEMENEVSDAYTWYDRAKEVDAGSHNVKIYLKTANESYPIYLRGTRATCGVGTVGTSETKVATIQTTGEGKGAFVIAGKAYEDPATVTGVLKADESEADKTTLDVEVTADGSTYSNNAALEAMLQEVLSMYQYTSSVDVACFLQWFASTFLMAATQP